MEEAEGERGDNYYESEVQVCKEGFKFQTRVYTLNIVDDLEKDAKAHHDGQENERKKASFYLQLPYLCHPEGVCCMEARGIG